MHFDREVALSRDAGFTGNSDQAVVEEVNRLLDTWREGDRSAFDQLITLLHGELRRLAHFQFSRERNNHTMQTHDLVSALYIKMLGSQSVPWQNHAHFLNAALRNMRQILIDHGRRWAKRAGGKDRAPLDELPEISNEASALAGDGQLTRMLALNQAIENMEKIDPAMAHIADLRLILGLTLEETARELNLPINKVKRDWLTIRNILAEKVLKERGQN